MAACSDLAREPVAVQPWTMCLHLATVAARLVAVDPEIPSLEEEPEFQLGPGMKVRSVCLPSPMTLGLLEDLGCTRVDGAEVWTPGSWDASLRPPGYDRLVGVEWWVANGPCPPQWRRPRRHGWLGAQH